MDENITSLIEEMKNKIDGLAEAMNQLLDQVRNLPSHDEFSELKTDIQAIKQIAAEQEERLGQN